MATLLSKQRVKQIQRNILDWYASNKRDLPWRRTKDPYHILVSEIMLQQTQVSRVIPKYEEFLRLFPTVNKLTIASSGDVIRAWKGLGYNRRALNLQRAARVIVDEHGGKVPSDLDALRKLPGIGRYTAGAIRNFAFGLDTPAVDTNVKQFLDHFVPIRQHHDEILPNPPFIKEGAPVFPSLGTRGLPAGRQGLGEISASRTENEYYDLAEQLMPKDKAMIWLHAVMDYSALVLKPNKTSGSTLRVEPRKSEPFVGSNRYLRGRIIDRLREKPETITQLYRGIAQPIDVEQQRFEALVTTLEAEGFLTRDKSTLRLVETTNRQ